MSPKISVIVPVYNAGKALRRCIDSILEQTFTDFELLLIDDGSTDGSGCICDEYAAQDTRVRVFHKENGGVSSARNLGLDNACGEWVTFVDADDKIDGLGIGEEDSDLVLGSIEIHNLHGNIRTESFCQEQMHGEQRNSFLYKNLQRTIFSICCAKFFNLKLLSDLRFDTLMRIGEDTVFMLRYLGRAKTISFNNAFKYIYYLMSDYETKYQQSVKESIYTLNNIFDAYHKLGIQNTEFQRNTFFNYKCYCQMAIYDNPLLWYGDCSVRKIYRKVANSLGVTYRIKYTLMSITLFSNTLNFIRKYRRQH